MKFDIFNIRDVIKIDKTEFVFFFSHLYKVLINQFILTANQPYWVTDCRERLKLDALMD